MGNPIKLLNPGSLSYTNQGHSLMLEFLSLITIMQAVR